MKKWQVDKLNAMLNDLEERGLETNKTANIKNALENMNTDLGKRGNQERFSKAKFALDDEIMQALGDDLKREYNRINEALTSEDFMKQDDLSEQDYLDMQDTEDEYITHAMEKHGLSSTQIQDIFNIVGNKGLSKKEYTRVIKEEINKALEQGNKKLGYRTVTSPDKMAKFMRQRFYRFKTRIK